MDVTTNSDLLVAPKIPFRRLSVYPHVVNMFYSFLIQNKVYFINTVIGFLALVCHVLVCNAVCTVQLRQFKAFITLVPHIYYRRVLVFHATIISINNITFMIKQLAEYSKK
jgi:hypothetical protein